MRSMRKTSRLFVLAWLAAPLATSLATAGLPVRLDLYVGASRVLQVNPGRVAVGNGAVVSVTTLPAGELLLLGESAGRTTLQLWLRDGSRHRVVVDVTANDMEATLRVVRELLAGVEGVGARPIGNRIVLDGLATGARAQDRAASIASLYPGVVLNFVGKVAWESMIHFDVRIVEVRSSALRAYAGVTISPAPKAASSRIGLRTIRTGRRSGLPSSTSAGRQHSTHASGFSSSAAMPPSSPSRCLPVAAAAAPASCRAVSCRSRCSTLRAEPTSSTRSTGSSSTSSPSPSPTAASTHTSILK